MARKTEVYSWRVSRALKVGLEEVARAERRTVAQLLDDIVAGHLETVGRSGSGEAARQRRLHARGARFAGRLCGSDPDRASRARELVRSRLRRASRAR
jgi:hypothetical protein